MENADQGEAPSRRSIDAALARAEAKPAKRRTRKARSDLDAIAEIERLLAGMRAKQRTRIVAYLTRRYAS